MASNQRNIWVGDLAPESDDNTLRAMFDHVGDIESIRVMRTPDSNLCRGYGFVTFRTPESALRAVELNNQPIPGTNRYYKINWGSGGGGGFSSGPPPAVDVSIYVGELDPSVNDEALFNLFKPQFTSVRSAKVLTDHFGNSKGFGFVRFADANEASQAIVKMNGFIFFNRKIKVSTSSGKGSFVNPNQRHPHSFHQPQPPLHQGGPGRTFSHHQQYRGPPRGGEFQAPARKRANRELPLEESIAVAISVASDPKEINNSTVFVGNLPGRVSEEILYSSFGQYGRVESVKVLGQKNIAFVLFSNHTEAASAITGLHNQTICGNQIRLGWGKGNFGAGQRSALHESRFGSQQPASLPQEVPRQHPNSHSFHSPSPQNFQRGRHPYQASPQQQQLPPQTSIAQLPRSEPVPAHVALTPQVSEPVRVSEHHMDLWAKAVLDTSDLERVQMFQCLT
ncbi:hypothetical protein P9112_004276 [Eukaryota sp. TZLM1-RC]